MKNKYYTAFCVKNWDPTRSEQLLIETEDKAKFKRAIERAKEQDLKLTRIYKPETELKMPDFTQVFNY